MSQRPSGQAQFTVFLSVTMRLFDVHVGSACALRRVYTTSRRLTTTTLSASSAVLVTRSAWFPAE